MTRGIRIDSNITREYVIDSSADGSGPSTEEKLLIQLSPNSKFGEGQHVSTRLILQMLPRSVRPGGKVLDAGTGTGILAIAAIKAGAGEAIAFDNHDWTRENAVENFVLNGVRDRVTYRSGDIDSVPEEGFDLILANITVDVLKRMMPSFRRKLKPGGRLLLSGLLQRDKEMPQVLSEHDFSLVEDRAEDEWWALAAERL